MLWKSGERDRFQALNHERFLQESFPQMSCIPYIDLKSVLLMD